MLQLKVAGGEDGQVEGMLGSIAYWAEEGSGLLLSYKENPSLWLAS